MKAEVINNNTHYASGIEPGTIVTIVEGMQADGADVFNAPIGKCYLCRTDDGHQKYVAATLLKIIDTDNEWRDIRRQYAAMFVQGMLANSDERMSCDTSDENLAKGCVKLAEALIEELKKVEAGVKEAEQPPKEKHLIDISVGEVFEYNGKKYKVETAPVDGGCNGCDFNLGNSDCDNTLCCYKSFRKDNIDVIFKEVKG